MANRIYNLKRQQHDERDLKFAHAFNVHSGVKLPAKLDLRLHCPPVWNQGDLGACSAFAGCAVRAMLATNNSLELSRLFLYYQERVLENCVNEDSGATIKDICQALQKYGVCEEKDWPYEPMKFAVAPPEDVVKKALINTIKSYTMLEGVLQVKQYLAFKQQPVLVGMDVFESFESDSVAKTGMMPLPKASEQNLGGHAVAIVGYSTALFRNKGGFILRNSWGNEWGDKGYFYMPFDYVNKGLAFDFWTIA